MATRRPDSPARRQQRLDALAKAHQSPHASTPYHRPPDERDHSLQKFRRLRQNTAYRRLRLRRRYQSEGAADSGSQVAPAPRGMLPQDAWTKPRQ